MTVTVTVAAASFKGLRVALSLTVSLGGRPGQCLSLEFLWIEAAALTVQ